MSSENYKVKKPDPVFLLTFTVPDWVDILNRNI